MAAFEAWLVFLILVVNVVGEFNGKEHLRHRAVSLRQHGFLVVYLYRLYEFQRFGDTKKQIKVGPKLATAR